MEYEAVISNVAQKLVTVESQWEEKDTKDAIQINSRKVEERRLKSFSRPKNYQNIKNFYSAEKQNKVKQTSIYFSEKERVITLRVVGVAAAKTCFEMDSKCKYL